MKSCIRDILFVLVWLVIFGNCHHIKRIYLLTIVSIIFLIYFYDKESEYLYPIIILVILDYPGYFYFGLTDNIFNISFLNYH